MLQAVVGSAEAGPQAQKQVIATVREVTHRNECQRACKNAVSIATTLELPAHDQLPWQRAESLARGNVTPRQH
jgi:hypothetical protein